MGLMQKALGRAGLVLIAALAGIGIVPITATAGPFPTWDDQITGPNRFDVLTKFSGKAVLDKETGLVWEQAPDIATVVWTSPFAGAVEKCYRKSVGGRRGWRLPTIEELNSLTEGGQQNPALPPGHPFSIVSNTYWSITTDPSLPSRAYMISFSDGGTGVASKSTNKFRAWCVRGNHGYDGL